MFLICQLRFLWEYESVWIDSDGTFTADVVGGGQPETVVVPATGILPSTCVQDAAFSVNSLVMTISFFSII